jgi:hypothetical protein
VFCEDNVRLVFLWEDNVQMWDYATTFALTSVQTQALVRILTGIIRLYQKQAEKSDHKRTWAGISIPVRHSNLCTHLRISFWVPKNPKRDPREDWAKYRDPRVDWVSHIGPMSNLYIYTR